MICVARLDRLHACEQRVTSKRDDSGELQSPKNCCRARLTVIGAVICLQLTAENYSHPAAPMLASSRYSPAVPIKLAKHARQLNLFAIPTKEISGAKHVQPCFIECCLKYFGSPQAISLLHQRFHSKRTCFETLEPHFHRQI